MNASTLCYPAEDKQTGKWRIMVMVKVTNGDKEVVKVMIAEGEYQSEAQAAAYANVIQQQFMKVGAK